MDNLDRALEDCLAQLASGKATLEECLARYPEHAPELRRLLTAVYRLEAGRAVLLSPAAKARGRARLMAHMRAHPRGRPATVPPLTLRLATGVAIAVFVFLSTGTAFAQTALPGDALYGWKIASERVWRAVQTDPLTADLALADRRAYEWVRVVSGNPEAAQLALQGYQRALADLSRYDDPASQAIIYQALGQQQEDLNRAGLSVPALNNLLLTTTTEQAVTSTPTLLLPVVPAVLATGTPMVGLSPTLPPPNLTVPPPVATVPPLATSPALLPAVDIAPLLPAATQSPQQGAWPQPEATLPAPTTLPIPGVTLAAP